jgi:hypothetical protein
VRDWKKARAIEIKDKYRRREGMIDVAVADIPEVQVVERRC